VWGTNSDWGGNKVILYKTYLIVRMLNVSKSDKCLD